MPKGKEEQEREDAMLEIIRETIQASTNGSNDLTLDALLFVPLVTDLIAEDEEIRRVVMDFCNGMVDSLPDAMPLMMASRQFTLATVCGLVFQSIAYGMFLERGQSERS